LNLQSWQLFQNTGVIVSSGFYQEDGVSLSSQVGTSTLSASDLMIDYELDSRKGPSSWTRADDDIVVDVGLCRKSGRACSQNGTDGEFEAIKNHALEVGLWTCCYVVVLDISILSLRQFGSLYTL
jgi:hypothetical protein